MLTRATTLLATLLVMGGCTEAPQPTTQKAAQSDGLLSDQAEANHQRGKAAGGSATRDGKPVESTAASTAALNLRDAMQDDPLDDGWHTEAFNLAAASQLSALAKSLAGGDAEPASFFAADAKSTNLNPPDRTTLLENDWLRVEEALASDSSPAQFTTGREVAGHLVDAYAWLARPEARTKFKVIEVQPDGNYVDTRVMVAFSGQRGSNFVEQHATWDVRWAVGDISTAQDKPLVARIRLNRLVQSTRFDSQRALLEDVTSSAFAANRSYTEQMLFGLNHWLHRTPFRMPMSFFGPTGLAVGDVNGDGLEDIYLCQDASLPNLLFLQEADGSLRDVSAEWGVDWIEDCRSALLVDLDNDGDQDLIVGVLGGVVIAANDKQQGFKVRDVLPTRETVTSLAAADYDLDGRIDIYVCAYDPDELMQDKKGQIANNAGPFVYYDSNNGAPNSCFRNTSTVDKLQFQEVTQDVGLDANNQRWSYAAAWEDFDNDGDLDLYVANDFGRNNLYENRRDADGFVEFRDIAASANVEDSASGMSVSWGDVDRDGMMDLYVGNMWSSAGKRIVAQEKFKPSLDRERREVFLRFARGNTLFRNVPGEQFEDVSEQAGATMGRWAWSAPIVDIDNDGWQDLLVANGYITAGNSGDL